MKPAVKVLVDTYNHERFIENAIVSVLEQDFPSSETEILVVNDGSSDRTAEIVGKFRSPVALFEKQTEDRHPRLTSESRRLRVRSSPSLMGTIVGARQVLASLTPFTRTRQSISLGTEFLWPIRILAKSL